MVLVLPINTGAAAAPMCHCGFRIDPDTKTVPMGIFCVYDRRATRSSTSLDATITLL